MRLTQLRLFFLLPFPPRLDATHGGGRTAAQVLAHLSTHHRIALMYLRAPADPPLDPILRERCELVEEVMRPNPGFSLASGRARIRSLLRGWPLWVAGCSVAAFRSRVRVLAGTWRPDIVNVEFHVMGQYLSSLDDCPAPRLLIQHEPGAAAARDLWQSSRGIGRAIRYFDMLAWERFERTIISQVQSIVVFTERDREALAHVPMSPPVICIPSGTVLPKQPLNPHGDEPLNLLFVGNFKHPPNVDAAVRLVNAIFPRVQAHIPGLRLHIVGDQPTARVRELANETIVVTGRVPDVTPYLDRAAVVVVPLRMGGGLRVKVKEALAAGKAVVASRLAVEGLDVVDGNQILLAESDEQFVDTVVHLLNYPDQRAALATRASAWACVNLGWERSIAAYEALYESLIREFGNL
ncbi:MAG: glycosyltransferase [Nitrospirae bacterium]|nr:glycosyltransferase [Nitrospirota bacterium]MDE3218106.1 glycosyltransferase [Nitrospirota bacterium]